MSTFDSYEHLADWYDAMYAAMGIKPLVYQPALVASLLELFRELSVSSILDCACGTGNPIIGLANQAPNLQIVGTDGSHKMLARCAVNALAEGVRLAPLNAAESPGTVPTLELGIVGWDALPHSFSGRQFDFIMCRGHAIYHLCSRHAIVAMLKAMATLVRAGGYILADTIDWTPDMRGEVGREAVKFRGWLSPDHPLNPLGRRLVFVDSCDYIDAPDAVRGIIQTKTLHILIEEKGAMVPKDSISVHGAPFSDDDLADMMKEAGLVEIRKLKVEERYPCVLAQRV